jgi:hypothetical protein
LNSIYEDDDNEDDYEEENEKEVEDDFMGLEIPNFISSINKSNRNDVKRMPMYVKTIEE